MRAARQWFGMCYDPKVVMLHTEIINQKRR